MSRARLLLCALLALGLQACTTTTVLTTTLPHTGLVVDDKDYGPIPDGGIEVEAKPGFAPLPWRLFDGETVVAEGGVPRTEVVNGIVAGAVAGAVCCIPSAVAAGFCLANPALLAAPLTCLVAGPGVFVSALQAPSWLSIPLSCGGAALGSTPLLLGLIGQAPPPTATLERAPAPPSTAARDDGEIPW
ncbi:MAG: hypothetical protein Q8O67_27520 [Deltaproteobacteria bacterium]|nr:hypothetical protein [Deltaproteobacteria bacterium]